MKETGGREIFFYSFFIAAFGNLLKSKKEKMEVPLGSFFKYDDDDGPQDWEPRKCEVEAMREEIRNFRKEVYGKTDVSFEFRYRIVHHFVWLSIHALKARSPSRTRDFEAKMQCMKYLVSVRWEDLGKEKYFPVLMEKKFNEKVADMCVFRNYFWRFRGSF